MASQSSNTFLLCFHLPQGSRVIIQYLFIEHLLCANTGLCTPLGDKKSGQELSLSSVSLQSRFGDKAQNHYKLKNHKYVTLRWKGFTKQHRTDHWLNWTGKLCCWSLGRIYRTAEKPSLTQKSEMSLGFRIRQGHKKWNGQCRQSQTATQVQVRSREWESWLRALAGRRQCELGPKCGFSQQDPECCGLWTFIWR